VFRSLVKALIPRRLFKAVEPYGHLAEAVVMNIRYGFPAREMNVIGVTGTDGKTTTSTLIASILRTNGYKVGLLTTVSVDEGNGPRPNPTRLTVMTSGAVLKAIKNMKQNGVQWVVLEVTSHALAQNRVWGVPFSVAVMTNIAHEHLDYHGTFENYRDAKRKLFTLAGGNAKGLQVGVVNSDDPSGTLFAGEVPYPLRYGVKLGDVKAEDIKTTSAGSHYVVRRGDQVLHITTHLPGSFNVYNSLAAVCVGLALNIDSKGIEAGIESLQAVEGRMTRVDEGQNFSVIIDYAHTPDSFQKVFSEIRPVTKGKLISVFGSAGLRDHAKRPMQGEVAGRLGDVVIVTEEDDRTEDGMVILDEIAQGAEKAGKIREQNLFLIHDRTEAINQAIKMAKPGDTVLLLGKGHERSILGNGGKRDWNEEEAARSALKNLKTAIKS
jgi:UDP-N-acetylmuramoyl-L-alanyl-D-glutamate--2,6-diaminopimelate ligase